MNKKPTKSQLYIIAVVIGAIVCCVIALFIVAPWKSTNRDSSPRGNDAPSQTADYNKRGDCKFYECLTKLTANSSEEEATSVIGFEPEKKIDGDNYDYTWTFDEDHSISMHGFKKSGSQEITTSSIKLENYETKDLADNRVKLDKLSEIKANLNKGDGVSYDQFKEYVGGVDGTVVELGGWTKYEWVAGDGKSHVTGQFSNETNKCMFMNGMTY